MSVQGTASLAVAAGPHSFIRSLSAAPQPLVALPSFLFVDTFFQLLPLALGFAAGCMLWMVFAELLPDALNDAKHSKVSRNRPQLCLCISCHDHARQPLFHSRSLQLACGTHAQALAFTSAPTHHLRRPRLLAFYLDPHHADDA